MLYFIQIIHVIIVIGNIISVIIPNRTYKKICLTLLLLMLIKFLSGSTKCGLTEIEYQLKGESYKEGFIYRFVKPIITMPEKYFTYYLWFYHCLWILILSYQLSL